VVAGLLDTRDFVQELPGRVNRALDAIGEGDMDVRVRVVDESHLMAGLHQSANRVSAALVLAALIVGTSLLTMVESSFTVLGHPFIAVARARERGRSRRRAGRGSLRDSRGWLGSTAAGAAFVIGTEVARSAVVADWPGLAPAQLYENRDLKPTMDARAVLKGVIAGSFDLTAAQADRVFPVSAEVRPCSDLMA